MPLITLTTDYGLGDHYVAALKGDIYANVMNATIVDITHQIASFNLLQAAYSVRNSAPLFPEGSIHFISINVRDGNKRFLLVQRDNRFYICPDNGLICLIFPDEKFESFIINELPEQFDYQDIHKVLCKVINQIQSNVALEEIGKATNSYLPLRYMQPIVNEDMITGSVFQVDSFKNLVVNVNKTLFHEVMKDRPFTIEFRNNKLHKICTHYSEVPEGELLCLFNSAGFLEIAINKGNASGLLGLEYGSNILIEASNIPTHSNLGINDY